ncbi:hypothetical protein LWI28_013917 [Acer negundo]|uniref:Endonuclease/exonuclease/phosphatase domain-containing protein n=1 Tax=Acer negundo TaxID=4023 RepID=A0AAD5IZM5_ACENE|nr:hypothetical protein LWI28_013917 [Acer negundo]
MRSLFKGSGSGRVINGKTGKKVWLRKIRAARIGELETILEHAQGKRKMDLLEDNEDSDSKKSKVVVGCQIIEAYVLFLSHNDVKIRILGGLFWRFTSFYGHPEKAQRIHLWTLLRRLAGTLNLPWVCMGDYNDTQYNCENRGGLRKSWKAMSDFHEAMVDSGLEDIGFKSLIFTWSNKREGDVMILERLDRGLCNRGWKNLFSNSIIHHLEFWGLDHRPLVLEVQKNGSSPVFGNKARVKRRFYFEECWVENDECKDIVLHVWKPDTTYVVSFDRHVPPPIKSFVTFCTVSVRKVSTRSFGLVGLVIDEDGRFTVLRRRDWGERKDEIRVWGERRGEMAVMSGGVEDE